MADHQQTEDPLRDGREGRRTGGAFSQWPESIFAFVSVWPGLTRQFEVLAIDLPGFGRSEARDDLLRRRRPPSILFAAVARPDLLGSLTGGAGASTYPSL
jgi:pimeloyl-ACP methyl ester carboxylesterase